MNKFINDFKSILNIEENTKITAYCWIYNIRIHKNISFIVLRNNRIFLQAIAQPDKISETYISTLTKESYICIEGIVKYREEKNFNNEQLLGKIELVITRIETINVCYNNKVDISRIDKDDPAIRYKYRYLDLRNNKSMNYLLFKSELIYEVRKIMYNNDFKEINTPIITSNSMEGANVYLVLSRKFPGCAYSLPQSPQIYKQLLMCAGMLKYFQIAPCFRDESARQNRIPTDFYQIDIEMCNVTEKSQVTNYIDSLMKQVIEKFGQIKKIESRNFTYQEAIEMYGYDKVDIRVVNELDLKYVKGKLRINFNQAFYDKIIELNLQNFIEKDVINNFLFIEVNDKNREEIYTSLSNSIVCDYISYCWITDYPAYCYNNMGELKFNQNPFAKPIDPDVSTQDMKIHQYDLIINGEEIGGGSLRNTDYNVFIKMFKNIGYTEQQIYDEFSYFIDALRSGMPYHGGIAIGIERLCCLLANHNLIRDFIAFPFQQNGYDNMMDSPRKTSESEINYYGFNSSKQNES